MYAKLEDVKLNKEYQIKFTLSNEAGEFVFDMKDLLKYPAYKKLADVNVFLNASFDDDIIFWSCDCDMHIDQLLSMSVLYSLRSVVEWISAKKKSYYEYVVNHWEYA